MLGHVVLHDMVVPMRINTDVWLLREAVFQHAAEYAVSIGIAGYAMDHMIWK